MCGDTSRQAAGALVAAGLPSEEGPPFGADFAELMAALSAGSEAYFGTRGQPE